MDGDSVARLENEVIEFLREWSSTSSETVGLQRVDSGDDSQRRTDELSSETSVTGGVGALTVPHTSVGDRGGMPWRGGDRLRSRGGHRPYRVGILQVRARSQAVGRWGSYAAEMKAASPGRYKRLRERMDQVLDR